MFLTKLKLSTTAVVCAGLFVALIGGSWADSAQDTTPRPELINPLNQRAGSSKQRSRRSSQAGHPADQNEESGEGTGHRSGSPGPG
jgi:hypothetical protein